ncbi:hypothetical protein FHH13_21405 [Escherichia coli]|nr:hypothetical protein [Escherichia coli]
MVASWFGSRSAWRGQQFPVHYNQLPSSNATLANHPVLLAVMAASSVMLLAWVLWRILRIISRHRLNLKQKK